MRRWLVLMLGLMLVTVHGVQAQGAGLAELRVRLVDAQGAAVAGVTVTLQLYTFERGVARVWQEAACVSDAGGECRFAIPVPPPDGGLLRGVVTVEGYGKRDVLWPGGELSLTLRLDRLEEGREAGPYEGQARDGGVRVWSWWRWAPGIVLVALWLGLTVWLYWRVRQGQEGRV